MSYAKIRADPKLYHNYIAKQKVWKANNKEKLDGYKQSYREEYRRHRLEELGLTISWEEYRRKKHSATPEKQRAYAKNGMRNIGILVCIHQKYHLPLIGIKQGSARFRLS